MDLLPLTAYASVPSIGEGSETADSHSQPALRIHSGNLDRLALPPSFGTVEEIHPGAASRPAVILIQDAHSIPSAQRSIRRLIERLFHRHEVAAAGVEGAAGPMDAFFLRQFPDRERLEDLLEGMIARGEISGATAAAALGPAAIQYRGVEDPALYEKAVTLYLDFQRSRSRFEEEIRQLRSRIETAKKEFYPQEWTAIDQGLRRLHEDGENLETVLGLLAAQDSGAESLKNYPHIAVLLEEIRRTENEPEKTQAEREAKLKKIRGREFFRELDAWSAAVRENLLKSGEARETERLDRTLSLFENLLKLELSRSEWQALTALRKTPEIYKTAALENLAQDLQALAAGLENRWRPAFEFYRNAEARDGRMIENLQRWAGETRQSAVILVTGGFHVPGIKRILEETNTAYAVLSPAMTEIPEDNFYLRAMQGRVSWEKYFENRRGQLDLFDAFHRAVAEKLTAADGWLLKPWRDALIRGLAAEGRLQEAGAYTRFFEDGRSRDLEKEWLAKVQNLAAEFKKFAQQKQPIGAEQISGLLAKPAATPWTAHPLVRGLYPFNWYARGAENLPADETAAVQPARRSEVRSSSRPEGIYRDDEITRGMDDIIGRKATILASFGQDAADALQTARVQVPRFFAVSSEITQHFAVPGQKVTGELQELLEPELAWIGTNEGGEKFMDSSDPLFISVRAAAPRIMPGQYMTILNVGLNDATLPALALRLGSERLAKSRYAKLIEDILADIYGAARADMQKKTLELQTPRQSGEHSVDWHLRAIKKYYREFRGEPFPQDGYEQIHRILEGIHGRARYNSPETGRFRGGVIFQRMVFGVGRNSYSGELRSRDADTGELTLSGNIEPDVQGDETTGRVRVDSEFFTRHPIFTRKLTGMMEAAENFLRDAAQAEVTIENNQIYLLQIKPAERTPQAEPAILMDMLKRNLLTPEQAYERAQRINIEELKTRRTLQGKEKLVFLGRGVPVSPGVAVGHPVITDAGVYDFGGQPSVQESEHPFILIKPEIRAHDHDAIRKSAGVISLYQFGNHAESLSLAAHVPAALGVTFEEIDMDEGRLILRDPENRKVIIDETDVNQQISLDADGSIYLGAGEIRSEPRILSKETADFLAWKMKYEGKTPVFKVRRYGFAYERNIDTPREDMVSEADYYRTVRDGTLWTNRPHLIEILDVVEAQASASGPKKAEPARENRTIPAEIVQQAVREILASSDGAHFAFHLWGWYKGLEEKAYRHQQQTAGLPGSAPPENIRYTNGSEMRLEIFRAVLRAAPDRLAESVFVLPGLDSTVGLHKPWSFTFKKGLVGGLPEEEARQFVTLTLAKAMPHGVHHMDYMMARILAELVKENPEFLKRLAAQLNPEQRGWMIESLYELYEQRKFEDRTKDPELPKRRELAVFLSGIADIEFVVMESVYQSGKSIRRPSSEKKQIIEEWIRNEKRSEVRTGDDRRMEVVHSLEDYDRVTRDWQEEKEGINRFVVEWGNKKSSVLILDDTESVSGHPRVWLEQKAEELLGEYRTQWYLPFQLILETRPAATDDFETLKTTLTVLIGYHGLPAARSEVRQKPQVWMEKQPDLARISRTSVMSLQMEMGHHRRFLEAVRKKHGRKIAEDVAQAILTGGLGALMHDLFPSWKANGLDVIGVLPIWEEIKQHPRRHLGLGKYQRELLEQEMAVREDKPLEFELEMDWNDKFLAYARKGRDKGEKVQAAYGRKIHVRVLKTLTTHYDAPIYFLDAYYLDDQGKPVRVFDEVYSDENAWRIVHMKIYARAAEKLAEILQLQGVLKPGLAEIHNEVFVSMPKKRRGRQGKRHLHINHSAYLPTMFEPDESAYEFLGFPEWMRPYIVKEYPDGRRTISIVDYVALSYGRITGVSIDEHLEVLLRNIFRNASHKTKAYIKGRLRSTNGVLVEQWQSPMRRQLIRKTAEQMNLPEDAESEDFYSALRHKRHTALRNEFKRRNEWIKAADASDFLIWMAENQENSIWLDQLLQDSGETDTRTLRAFQKAVRKAVQSGDERRWQEIEKRYGRLKNALFAHPIASNVRRQVPYKGPEKWLEVLLKKPLLEIFGQMGRDAVLALLRRLEPEPVMNSDEDKKRSRLRQLMKNIEEHPENWLDQFDGFFDLFPVPLVNHDLFAEIRPKLIGTEAVKNFRRRAGRFVIGGREFSPAANADFQAIKASIGLLGLEQHLAAIENYNIYDAPRIFRAMAGVVMLSDEFLEASATSMEKGLVDGAALIGVWGGADPELFRIVAKGGKVINIFERKVSHDDVAEKEDAGAARIVNGMMVRYSNEQSLQGGGGRRPSAQSLEDALFSLNEIYQDEEKRRELLWEAVASTPKVDMREGQARAHIRMLEEMLEAQQDEEELFNSLQYSAADARRAFSPEADRFVWHRREHQPLEPTAPQPGLAAFIDDFRRIATWGSGAERGGVAVEAVRYHALRGDIMPYLLHSMARLSGSKPIAKRVRQMADLAGELLKQLAELKQESVWDTEEIIRLEKQIIALNLSAIELADSWLLWLSGRTFEAYISTPPGAKLEKFQEQFARNRGIHSYIARYLDEDPRAQSLTADSGLRAFRFQEHGRSFVVALNVSGAARRGSQDREKKSRGKILSDENLKQFLNDVGVEPDVHFRIRDGKTGELYGLYHPSNDFEGIRLGIPPEGIQVLELVPKREKALTLLTAMTEKRNVAGPLRELMEEIQRVQHDANALEGLLEPVAALPAARARELFGVQTAAMLTLIAGLVPAFTDRMREWHPGAYAAIKRLIAAEPRYFETGQITFHHTSRESAVVFSRSISGGDEGRNIIFALQLEQYPVNREDGKVWSVVDGLGSTEGKLLRLDRDASYQVENLMSGNRYARIRSGSEIMSRWEIGIPVWNKWNEKGRKIRDDWGVEVYRIHKVKPAVPHVRARPKMLRASAAKPVRRLALAVNLRDAGAEITPDHSEIRTVSSLDKLENMIPRFEEAGFGTVYGYGGRNAMEKISRGIHSVEHTGRHHIADDEAAPKVLVSVTGYDTKRQGELRDEHGNAFAPVSLLEPNPELSNARGENGEIVPGTAEKTGRRIREVNAALRRRGMRARADFIAWVSPGAVNAKNYKQFFYYELPEDFKLDGFTFNSLPGEDLKKKFMARLIEEGGHFVIRIGEPGHERLVLIRHMFEEPGRDQAMPNPFHPEVRDYYRRALRQMIDEGYDSVRVDLGHKFRNFHLRRLFDNLRQSGWQVDAEAQFREEDEIWADLIADAKAYYREKHPEDEEADFEFLMEAYDAGDHEHLRQLGADAVYYENAANDYERMSAGDPAVKARQISGTFMHAYHSAHGLVPNHPALGLDLFPSNYDRKPLKAVGGYRRALIAALTVLAKSGVPVTLDMRDLLDFSGQPFPIPGKHHPFPSEEEMTRIENFDGLMYELENAPLMRTVGEIHRLLPREEYQIEELDNSNRDQFISYSLTETGKAARPDRAAAVFNLNPHDDAVMNVRLNASWKGAGKIYDQLTGEEFAVEGDEIMRIPFPVQLGYRILGPRRPAAVRILEDAEEETEARSEVRTAPQDQQARLQALQEMALTLNDAKLTAFVRGEEGHGFTSMRAALEYTNAQIDRIMGKSANYAKWDSKRLSRFIASAAEIQQQLFILYVYEESERTPELYRAGLNLIYKAVARFESLMPPNWAQNRLASLIQIAENHNEWPLAHYLTVNMTQQKWDEEAIRLGLEVEKQRIMRQAFPVPQTEEVIAVIEKLREDLKRSLALPEDQVFDIESSLRMDLAMYLLLLNTPEAIAEAWETIREAGRYSKANAVRHWVQFAVEIADVFQLQARDPDEAGKRIRHMRDHLADYAPSEDPDTPGKNLKDVWIFYLSAVLWLAEGNRSAEALDEILNVHNAADKAGVSMPQTVYFAVIAYLQDGDPASARRLWNAFMVQAHQSGAMRGKMMRFLNFLTRPRDREILQEMVYEILRKPDLWPDEPGALEETVRYAYESGIVRLSVLQTWLNISVETYRENDDTAFPQRLYPHLQAAWGYLIDRDQTEPLEVLWNEIVKLRASDPGASEALSGAMQEHLANFDSELEHLFTMLFVETRNPGTGSSVLLDSKFKKLMFVELLRSAGDPDSLLRFEQKIEERMSAIEQHELVGYVKIGYWIMKALRHYWSALPVSERKQYENRLKIFVRTFGSVHKSYLEKRKQYAKEFGTYLYPLSFLSDLAWLGRDLEMPEDEWMPYLLAYHRGFLQAFADTGTRDKPNAEPGIKKAARKDFTSLAPLSLAVMVPVVRYFLRNGSEEEMQRALYWLDKLFEEAKRYMAPEQARANPAMSRDFHLSASGIMDHFVDVLFTHELSRTGHAVRTKVIDVMRILRGTPQFAQNGNNALRLAHSAARMGDYETVFVLFPALAQIDPVAISAAYHVDLLVEVMTIVMREAQAAGRPELKNEARRLAEAANEVLRQQQTEGADYYYAVNNSLRALVEGRIGDAVRILESMKSEVRTMDSNLQIQRSLLLAVAYEKSGRRSAALDQLEALMNAGFETPDKKQGAAAQAILKRLTAWTAALLPNDQLDALAELYLQLAFSGRFSKANQLRQTLALAIYTRGSYAAGRLTENMEQWADGRRAFGMAESIILKWAEEKGHLRGLELYSLSERILQAGKVSDNGALNDLKKIRERTGRGLKAKDYLEQARRYFRAGHYAEGLNLLQQLKSKIHARELQLMQSEVAELADRLSSARAQKKVIEDFYSAGRYTEAQAAAGRFLTDTNPSDAGVRLIAENSGRFEKVRQMAERLELNEAQDELNAVDRSARDKHWEVVAGHLGHLRHELEDAEQSLAQERYQEAEHMIDELQNFLRKNWSTALRPDTERILTLRNGIADRRARARNLAAAIQRNGSLTQMKENAATLAAYPEHTEEAFRLLLSKAAELYNAARQMRRRESLRMYEQAFQTARLVYELTETFEAPESLLLKAREIISHAAARLWLPQLEDDYWLIHAMVEAENARDERSRAAYRGSTRQIEFDFERVEFTPTGFRVKWMSFKRAGEAPQQADMMEHVWRGDTFQIRRKAVPEEIAQKKIPQPIGPFFRVKSRDKLSVEFEIPQIGEGREELLRQLRNELSQGGTIIRMNNTVWVRQRAMLDRIINELRSSAADTGQIDPDAPAGPLASTGREMTDRMTGILIDPPSGPQEEDVAEEESRILAWILAEEAKIQEQNPDFRLDDEQRRALAAVLNSHLPFVFIQGPPGTGKTTTIGWIVELFYASNKGVLVSSQQNHALDNVAANLVNAGKPLKMARLGNREEAVEREEVEPLHENKARLLAEMEAGRGAGKGYVLFGTSNGWLDHDIQKHLALQNGISVLIMDESTRATREETLLLIEDLKGVKKVVLVGDPLQLPAYGLSEDDRDFALTELRKAGIRELQHPRLGRRRPEQIFDPARRENFRISFFERALDTFLDGDEDGSIFRLTRPPFYILDVQRRSGTDLVELHNFFYRSRRALQPGRTDTGRLVEIDTAGASPEVLRGDENVATVNYGEARHILEQAAGLLQEGIEAEAIAVVTPYQGQVDLAASGFFWFGRLHDYLARRETTGFAPRDKTRKDDETLNFFGYLWHEAGTFQEHIRPVVEAQLKEEAEFKKLDRARQNEQIESLVKSRWEEALRLRPLIEEFAAARLSEKQDGWNGLSPEEKSRRIRSAVQEFSKRIRQVTAESQPQQVPALASAIRDFLGLKEKFLTIEQIESGALEVVTVDSAIGREWDAVIISWVRSNAEGRTGFLTPDRRNVGSSRARNIQIEIWDAFHFRRARNQAVRDWADYRAALFAKIRRRETAGGTAVRSEVRAGVRPVLRHAALRGDFIRRDILKLAGLAARFGAENVAYALEAEAPEYQPFYAGRRAQSEVRTLLAERAFYAAHGDYAKRRRAWTAQRFMEIKNFSRSGRRPELALIFPLLQDSKPELQAELLALVRALKKSRIRSAIRIAAPVSVVNDPARAEFFAEIKRSGVAQALVSDEEGAGHRVSAFLRDHPNALFYGAAKIAIQGFEGRNHQRVDSNLSLEAVFPVALGLALPLASVPDITAEELRETLPDLMPGIVRPQGESFEITPAALELVYQQLQVSEMIASMA